MKYHIRRMGKIGGLIVLCLWINKMVVGQGILLKNQYWQIRTGGDGVLQSMIVKYPDGWDTIPVRQDSIYAGIRWYSEENGRRQLFHLKHTGGSAFALNSNGLGLQLCYQLSGNKLMVIAEAKNIRRSDYRPTGLGLILGINSYMSHYPQWNYRYFPTLMRCEKDHFWGYYMSPLGRILVVAAADPIACWHHDYEHYTTKIDGQTVRFGQHRIYTTALDLLHVPPLPERHPQNRSVLLPGQTICDTIVFEPVDVLRAVEPAVAKITRAPMIRMQQYNFLPGEPMKGQIMAAVPVKQLIIRDGNSRQQSVGFSQAGKDRYTFSLPALKNAGDYTLTAFSENGKQSEAVIYIRRNWPWYLAQARKEGLKYLPATTPNDECFYPLYTYFLAGRYVPDSAEDQACEQVFRGIFPQLFDKKKMAMREDTDRIQNTATMAGILTDRFLVTHDTIDLVYASGLVDFLIRHQKDDGGYYNRNTLFTATGYVAKSVMEVMTQEKKLALVSPVWKLRYNRHYLSVQAALKNLAYLKDNIQTEGQMTYADGMISCSFGQLAIGALRETDDTLKQQFLKVALELYNKHRCLTQLIIPDARMNGATLRFWESQYAINLMHNLMDSPCGWSMWEVYGTWYLYLLTGKKKFLIQTINGLAAGAQLLNVKTGELYFAFTPDPYIDAAQYLPLFPGSGVPVLKQVHVGEQYLPLTSNWLRPPFRTWRSAWGIDNFVHEVFKCISEVALTNAYIIENPDGSLYTYNCRVQRNRDKLVVSPSEPLVTNIHVNLHHTFDVSVIGSHKQYFDQVTGLRWLGAPPETLRESGLME